MFYTKLVALFFVISSNALVIAETPSRELRPKSGSSGSGSSGSSSSGSSSSGSSSGGDGNSNNADSKDSWYTWGSSSGGDAADGNNNENQWYNREGNPGPDANPWMWVGVVAVVAAGGLYAFKTVSFIS